MPTVELNRSMLAQIIYTSGSESRPKRVFFTDALPKNPSGKLLKRELRLTYEALLK